MLVDRVSPATLKSWLESPNPPAIVDVRDDDRIGGHVRGSIHVPSTKFLNKLPQLRQEVSDSDKVVFYCQFSQQRGPSCARHYAMQKTQPREDSGSQTVYVLDGGFSNWALTYNGQEGFTESFAQDLYL